MLILQRFISNIQVSEEDLIASGENEGAYTVGANLIPVINKLQEVLSILGSTLDLPQIVVVGGQSSGKSSVLEKLVGRDFLPRGTGIVTRRPLILQLNRLESGSDYAEFAHLPKKKFTDFRKVREEIEKDTERITGKNKGISPEPIILKIFSQNVVPLTLVDTPGIARVPVGDQPPDIEKQIREMVMGYIASPNAIVLAVHPANQDLATSDAIKLARHVDPSGSRTLGVITKLDLMDKGTNALDILTGKVINLQLGFVGVVNRSQLDIATEKSIQQNIEAEEQFFRSHPSYSLISNHCGCKYLAVKCNRILTSHIRTVLPKLKAEITGKLKKTKAELLSLGESLEGNLNDKKWMLMQILNNFTVDFSNAVDGSKVNLTTKELHGGARIRYIFDDVFKKQLDQLNHVDDIPLHEYRTAIRNAAGPRPALFVPDGAFELLVKNQILRLKEPALQSAELVLFELQRILAKLDFKELGRFIVLRERVMEVCNELLKECMKPTRRMINDLIECELAYINTNHPDFVGSTGANLLSDGLTKPPKVDPPPRPVETPTDSGFFSLFFGGKKKPEDDLTVQHKANMIDAMTVDSSIHSFENSELSERERIQLQLIKKLLHSYLEIAKKNIQDSVTKAIWYFLVNQTRENLSKKLITEIYQKEDLDRLLQESERTVERRKLLKAEIATLRRAKEILQISTLPLDN